MAKAKIDSEEISVVVQGPIFRDESLTGRALKSVRAALPRAQIILSTWEDAETHGLEFDELVTSQDPGGMCHIFPNLHVVPNNLSRQMVSTLAGLRLATRRYALKFRTDLLLRHAGFTNFFGLYEKRHAKYQVFSHRVVVFDHYVRNPSRANHLRVEYAPGHVHSFHPSDMAGFGTSADLLRFWDLPLPPFGFDLPAEVREAIDPQLLSKRFVRVLSEQYLWTECLRKLGSLTIPPEHVDDRSWYEESALTLANNFVVLRRAQFGVDTPKHPFNQASWSTLYTYGDFAALYQKYCDPSFRPAFDLGHTLKNFTYASSWAPTPAARAVRWLMQNLDFLKRHL